MRGRPDEEEPLIRRHRNAVETREGFYFGVPDTSRFAWEYCVIFCTFLLCCTFFVAIPILALVISGDRTCDSERIKGVSAPYDGELVPPQPIMVEYYTDWDQYSKLFDVYDGEKSNASQASRVGYFYYMNILSFLRFGYSEESDRVWFEGQYTSFASRLKPYADYLAQRCDKSFAQFKVVEDFWDRSYFCWSRCRRTFHVYQREKQGDAFAPYADAIFYDVDRWSNEGFGPGHYDVRLMNMTSVNYKGLADGTMLARARLRLGDDYSAVGLDALNRWLVEFDAKDKAVTSPPPHWLVTFVTAMDDVPNRSVAWVLAIFVAFSIACLCWLQRQEQRQVTVARRYD